MNSFPKLAPELSDGVETFGDLSLKYYGKEVLAPHPLDQPERRDAQRPYRPTPAQFLVLTLLPSRVNMGGIFGIVPFETFLRKAFQVTGLFKSPRKPNPRPKLFRVAAIVLVVAAVEILYVFLLMSQRET